MVASFITGDLNMPSIYLLQSEANGNLSINTLVDNTTSDTEWHTPHVYEAETPLCSSNLPAALLEEDSHSNMQISCNLKMKQSFLLVTVTYQKSR